MPWPTESADLPDSQPSRKGFIYALIHPAIYSPDGRPLLKVGATRKHPIRRATELGAGTGVPGQFIVAYWLPFLDCFEAENRIHERFAAQRTDPAREFFDITIEEVVAYARELAEELPIWGPEGGEWTEALPPVTKPVTFDLPWSELFATFPDDGTPRELTAEEQSKCRALAARLSS